MASTFRQQTRRNRGSLILCALFCASLIGAAPATQPTEKVQQLFDQLADPSATVRENAMDQMLGLSAADLPTVEKIVRASLPLRPSQRIVLRQIVSHLYNLGIEYEHDPQELGFIGMSYQSNSDAAQSGGIQVTDREPGFPAYRWLRDGDVVSAIEELPGIRFESTDDFRSSINGFHAGDTITFVVQREDKILHIPLKLRARPAIFQMGMTTVEAARIWHEDWRQRADAYWNKIFVPLLGNDLI